MGSSISHARGAEEVFPPNPDFGTGAYRRRIRLVREDGAMLAMLDDSNHAMWSRILHDGQHVTGVQGRTLRAPNTNCPFAAEALRELIGLPLNISRADLYGDKRAFRNCTHLFDAAALAIKYAVSDIQRRTFDVLIPDAPDGPTTATVAVDGRVVLEWRLQNGMLLEFEDTEGPVPMMRGFTRWAIERLEGELQEAAFVLQPAYFVSSSRGFIVDQRSDFSITELPFLAGACYAYQPERVASGTQVIGNVLDFSEGVLEQDEDATRQS